MKNDGAHYFLKLINIYMFISNIIIIKRKRRREKNFYCLFHNKFDLLIGYFSKKFIERGKKTILYVMQIVLLSASILNM